MDDGKLRTNEVILRVNSIMQIEFQSVLSSYLVSRLSTNLILAVWPVGLEGVFPLITLLFGGDEVI